MADSLDHRTIPLTQRHPALGAVGTTAFGMLSAGAGIAMVALALMVASAWFEANALLGVFSRAFEIALYFGGAGLLAMFGLAGVQGIFARRLTRPLNLRLYDSRLEIDDGQSIRRLPLATLVARLRPHRRTTADLVLSAPGEPAVEVPRLFLGGDEQDRLLSTIRAASRTAQERHGDGQAEIPAALRAIQAERTR